MSRVAFEQYKNKSEEGKNNVKSGFEQYKKEYEE